MPVSRKRGRDNFKQLVKECTWCPKTVLTQERIEKFASRARAYICTYHYIEQQQQQEIAVIADANSSAATTTLKQELLYSDIERISKAFKGHRCALDFDNGFVNSELREARAPDEGLL